LSQQIETNYYIRRLSNKPTNTKPLKPSMNVAFMPFELNSDFKEIAHRISYVDTYNEAKLYKVNAPTDLLQGMRVTDAHLYFLNEKLITVYLHLENNIDHIETLVKMLTLQLGLKGVLSRSQFGVKYRWEVDEEVLVLVKDQIHRKFYIYHALKKYSVF
jgi:hypothetical protein